jgi:small conductance mechanosensitive channel
LGEFSINIAVKPWVKVDDFVVASAEINQSILEEFRLKDIEIPFPQREVRLLNGNIENQPVAAGSEARRL